MTREQARRKAATYTLGSLLFVLLAFLTTFISIYSGAWAGLAIATLFAFTAWHTDQAKARFIANYIKQHAAQPHATAQNPQPHTTA